MAELSSRLQNNQYDISTLGGAQYQIGDLSVNQTKRGAEGMNDEKHVITLRWIHVILVLAIQLLTLGFIYGTLKVQVESDSRRIEKLEEQTSGMKEVKEEIMRRLDKLEIKLDLVINNGATKR